MTTIDKPYTELPLAQIVPSLTNPRRHFPADAMAELVNSIKLNGVIQPIVVRPLPAARVADTTHMDPRPSFEVVAGERRFRACSTAGLASIPTLVRALTDAEVLEVQLVENLSRADLSPLEEAEGYERLMHAHEPPLSAEDIGQRIGKSRAYVYARLKLLNLCSEGQQAMHEGWLTPSVALLVARLPSTKVQTDALKNLRRPFTDEALSTREAAAMIERQYMLRLTEARFKITDADLLPAAGSCRACPKRTGADPDLFADVKGADVCTDVACFRAKEQAHADAQLKQAREQGATIIEGREAKALVPHSWTDRIEGYLRLDSVEDSPNGKPLRASIGKLMEAEGVKPVMVANPHRDGELIACVDHATASRLLAKKGHQDQADKLQAEAERSAAAAEEAEQRKLTEKFENAWRWELLAATWRAVWCDDTHDPSQDLVRWVCVNHLMPHNQEHCARLCKLLELGDVAPRQALIDFINRIDNPHQALTLLAMFADREWRTWGDPSTRDNPALLAAAKAYHYTARIHPEAIKARVKEEMASALQAKAQAKQAREAAAAQPQEAPLPLPPAAQAKGVRGGKGKEQGKGSKTKTPAAPAAPKMGAEEALSGIAAAMQSNEGGADSGPLETNPGADAPGNEGPGTGPDAGAERGEVGDFAVGARVEVANGPWQGRVGTVTDLDDDNNVTVWIDGMGRHETPYFAPAELKPLPTEATTPDKAWPFPKGAI